jgi:hypothetical protein
MWVSFKREEKEKSNDKIKWIGVRYSTVSTDTHEIDPVNDALTMT